LHGHEAGTGTGTGTRARTGTGDPGSVNRGLDELSPLVLRHQGQQIGVDLEHPDRVAFAHGEVVTVGAGRDERGLVLGELLLEQRHEVIGLLGLGRAVGADPDPTEAPRQVPRGLAALPVTVLRRQPFVQQPVADPSVDPSDHGPGRRSGLGRGELGGEGAVQREEQQPLVGETASNEAAEIRTRDLTDAVDDDRITLEVDALGIGPRLLGFARSQEHEGEHGRPAQYAARMPPETRLMHALGRPGLDARDRLAVVGLAAIVRPDLELLHAVAERAPGHALPMREVCLQGILFAGFPRALTALAAITDVLPDETRTEADGPASAEVGRRVFRTVYGSQSRKVHDWMNDLDPVFAGLTIDTAYGRVLSRPALELRLRELMAVAALAVLDLQPQLLSHARGAVHAGAGHDEVFESLASLEVVFQGFDVGGHERALREFFGRGNGSGR